MTIHLLQRSKAQTPLPSVLLVEDDEVDVRCMQRIMQEHHIANPLRVARNGKEALALLQSLKENALPGEALPGVICLDLNMPVMNGWELLRALKRDAILCSIPVVLITSSDDNREVSEAFRLGAAGYFRKSFSFEQYAALLQTIFRYWNQNILPGVPHVDPA